MAGATHAAQPPQPSLRDRIHSLRRVREGAVLGGVCAGIGRAFGIDPLLIRVAFVAAAAAGGFGIVPYVLMVAFVPIESGSAAVGIARGARNWRVIAGVGLLTLSALLALRALGIWWSDAIAWPVVFTATGIAVLWRQTRGAASVAGDQPAPQWSGVFRSGALPELPRFGIRLLIGAALVVAGLISLLSATNALGTLRDIVIAAAVVLAGVTVIFGTSWLGLVGSLREERAARIRAQERAEVAAHLHDSVLQTLALIQRQASDAPQVATLARRQERELRAWLADGTTAQGEATTLAAALTAIAAEVETLFAVRVEVVTVGDAPLDESLSALVQAAREAAVNAAKFAGTGQVDVYAEVTGQRVEVFVRDRGPGFDQATVPADRRGIRESIVGRMERHGGRAELRTAPGEGVEVELVVDRAT